LHLHEHDDLAVAQHHVQLAGPAAPVAVEQHHSQSGEIAHGDPLAVCPYRVLGPRHRATVPRRRRGDNHDDRVLWTARVDVDSATPRRSGGWQSGLTAYPPSTDARCVAWPLVGRDDELRLVQAAMAGKASTSAVLIAGAAGVGKTRLAQEAVP